MTCGVELTAPVRIESLFIDSGKPSLGVQFWIKPMPIDPRWFEALKLPARVIAGLFLAATVVLLLDWFAVFKLAEIHALAWPLAMISAVVFGCLSLCALGGVIYDGIQQRHKMTLLAKRREMRRDEMEQRRAEYQKRALKRLDYLSAKEISCVADCLRKNVQSFTSWVDDPDVSNLMAARLVATPGGTHHQNYYPFYFIDFAWEALLKRKDEFVGKDDENKRLAKAAAEKQRLRALAR
jgi:hypothetical protein